MTAVVMMEYPQPNGHQTDVRGERLISASCEVGQDAAAYRDLCPKAGWYFADMRPTGNSQTLLSGNAFINWAYNSRISEHTPAGQLAMQAVLGVDVDSYRSLHQKEA